MYYKKVIALLLALCLVASSAACADLFSKVEPTAIPDNSATAIPTAASETAKVVSVTLDYSPAPTDTPIPTPEPTPTPVPTDTPEPTEIPFSYYAPTVNMSFEELVGGLDDSYYNSDSEVLWPEGYPPADTYQIIVDLYWQVVMVFSKDANGEYTQPVRYMLCSTGSARVGSETRQGTWKMQKCRVRFGEFVGDDAAQYWTLIRSRTYFHSVLYTYKDLDTYDVSEYEKLGTKCTHGCIRLPVPDARWIWYNIAYDTTCIIREGSKSDEATGAIRAQLILAEAPETRISLVPGLSPYTDNWTIDEVDTTVPFINEAPNRPQS